MGLQELDSFKLRSYSFAVRRTNSFFSLTTLLLSALILTAALLLNLSTLSHLWLPLQALRVDSTLSLELPQPLTPTLLCIRPSNASKIGRFRLFRSSESAQLSFRRVSESQVAISKPKLYAQIGGGFECVDLEGFAFNSTEDSVFVQVEDVAATMFVKSSSFRQILYGDFEPATAVQFRVGFRFTELLHLSYIKFSILDSLLSGTKPLIVNTVRADKSSKYLTSIKINAKTQYMFAFCLYTPANYFQTQSLNYNIAKYSVVRHNVGIILGSVLTWLSLFALLCGLIALPLMDCKLSLLTAETLFRLQPSACRPSLLRYAVASLKAGLFPYEDRFVRLCQKAERMKDVGAIVKMQQLLSRLAPQTPQSASEQLLAAEHTFNQVADSESAIQLFADHSETVQNTIQLTEDRANASCLESLRRKLLCFFDTGSDLVSVSYSRGGIGSQCSFAVTAAIGAAFLCFLYVCGVFSLRTVRTETLNKVSVVRYTTVDSELVLSVFNSASAPKVFLMDGDYKKLSEITLKNGTECAKTIPKAQLQKIQYNTNKSVEVYCFPSILLSQSEKPEDSRKMFIDLTEVNADTLVNLKQVNKKVSAQYNPVEVNCLSQFGAMSNDLTFRTIYTKLTTIQQDSNIVTLSQFLPSTTEKSNVFANGIKGTTIELLPEVASITLTKGTLFDVMQSVWSFSVLVFTVLVLKLTKYINLKHKEQRVTAQRAQFRDSICVTLSRIDGLLRGRHRAELQTLKYYAKERLCF